MDKRIPEPLEALKALGKVIDFDSDQHSSPEMRAACQMARAVLAQVRKE